MASMPKRKVVILISLLNKSKKSTFKKGQKTIFHLAHEFT